LTRESSIEKLGPLFGKYLERFGKTGSRWNFSHKMEEIGRHQE
jgi:hypothetical protein